MKIRWDGCSREKDAAGMDVRERELLPAAKMGDYARERCCREDVGEREISNRRKRSERD